MCLNHFLKWLILAIHLKSYFAALLLWCWAWGSLSEKSQSQNFPIHPPQRQLTPEVLEWGRLNKSTRPSWARVRAWQRKTTNTHATQHTENTHCWAGRWERAGGRLSLLSGGACSSSQLVLLWGRDMIHRSWPQRKQAEGSCDETCEHSACLTEGHLSRDEDT